MKLLKLGICATGPDRDARWIEGRVRGRDDEVDIVDVRWREPMDWREHTEP